MTALREITRRGFTDHEHLDSTGLIHMNGRVYDPTIARFVSADPFIDGVTNTQGWNRYSYVGNNPLSYADPSGYWACQAGPTAPPEARTGRGLQLPAAWALASTSVASPGSAPGQRPASRPAPLEDLTEAQTLAMRQRRIRANAGTSTSCLTSGRRSGRRISEPPLISRRRWIRHSTWFGENLDTVTARHLRFRRSLMYRPGRSRGRRAGRHDGFLADAPWYYNRGCRKGRIGCE